MGKAVRRTPVPKAIQSAVLVANRHACCVCQKPRVQLHHIDGNPKNNDRDNIATLCGDHHDMASMQIGLTKKLQPDQVKIYKASWEKKCTDDIEALSRQRFTFYYCIYKNPPRILEAYSTLGEQERKDAVERIEDLLPGEEPRKQSDSFFGLNAVPQANQHTLRALKSVYRGEMYPSYLAKFKRHPADPNYSTDCSTQEAMSAYHMYDLWCQIISQTLAVARGTTPLEDLFNLDDEESLDTFAGKLVTFRLSVYGRGVKIPRYWEEYPTSSIQARITRAGKIRRVRMQLRTMYLFSDTAATNLSRGRISGLGLFNGGVVKSKKEIELTVVPLVIGTGGWNLYP